MHPIELIPSNPKDKAGDVEFGMGLIPSDPDPRDYSLHDKLVADGYLPEVLSTQEMLATFPSSFVASSLPPVTNQGLTPQCVSYSEAMMKSWQDYRDQGQFFDFNENTFFYAIGGTPAGAVARYGLDYMLNTGYPLQDGTNAGQHKIKAYYKGSLAHEDIKAALMAYGPIVVAIHWPESWSHPYSNGVVPPPDGITNGHLILCVGWVDGMGFIFQNSWGTGWGISGRCYIPARYLSDFDGTEVRAFEIWKTEDVIETPVDVFIGHYVVIEGAYSMNLYTVGSSCTFTPKKVTFSGASGAPVSRGYCGGKTYWRTTAGYFTGLSYVCGLTTDGWHIVRRYRRPNGSTYDTRIACTGN